MLTVCEALHNLAEYNGKDVVIVGISGYTFEGNFMDEGCGPDGRTLIQEHWWLSMIYLREGRPANVSFDKDLVRRKLEDLMRQAGTSNQPTGPFAPKWVALYGRLVSPVKLRPFSPSLNPKMKSISGNGFGANGSVPAELLVHAELDLSATTKR